MKASLKDYSRIEVKASLKLGDIIWFGAADGLYRYRIAAAQAVPVKREQSGKRTGQRAEAG